MAERSFREGTLLESAAKRRANTQMYSDTISEVRAKQKNPTWPGGFGRPFPPKPVENRPGVSSPCGEGPYYAFGRAHGGPFIIAGHLLAEKTIAELKLTDSSGRKPRSYSSLETALNEMFRTECHDIVHEFRTGPVFEVPLLFN